MIQGGLLDEEDRNKLFALARDGSELSRASSEHGRDLVGASARCTGRPRRSKLDPFMPTITRLLDTHPYSPQQIFQRLREELSRPGDPGRRPPWWAGKI
jgi:hypothetical protein